MYAVVHITLAMTINHINKSLSNKKIKNHHFMVLQRYPNADSGVDDRKRDLL